LKGELAELVGALKQEGVQKGREEGGRIVSEGRREAAKIVEEARHEADRIVEEAKGKANATMSNLDQQMSLALRDTLLKAKDELTELVAMHPLREATDKALSDPEFIKKLIFEIISRYVKSRTAGGVKEELHIVIPEEMKGQFVKEWVAMMRSELETHATLHAEKGFKGFRLFTEAGGGELVVDTDSMLDVMRPFVSERFRRILDEGAVDLK
jgi:F0F1-type ATP synthase membrane subunit b/b'